MIHTDQTLAEKVGTVFHLKGMSAAREKTRSAVSQIAAAVEVGMAETEALEMSERLLASLGVVRKWHGTKIRFGENTTLTYGIPSKPNTILKADDIFFVDLGPVWDGFEGDYGASFVVGNDSEMHRCASDARTLFDRVKERWLLTGDSGEWLYSFASREAEKMGWQLLLEQANGHRLSDFPHTIHFKGAVADLGFRPSASLWVLEILIRHPNRPFGAFFEDLLSTD